MSLLNIVKTEIGISPYVTDTRFPLRSLLAKLRLSDHPLEIERGCYNNTIQCRRICKICGKNVEDVAHFLFASPEYSRIRTEMYGEIPEFKNQSINDQMYTLLNPNTSNMKIILTYLKTAMEVRLQILNPDKSPSEVRLQVPNLE